MSPIDYSGAFATENPTDAMMAGLKNGVAIRAMQDKRAAEEQAKLQQQAMQDDMEELSANPTAARIAAYSIKYPQLSEQFKRSWDMVEPAEKQAKLETATQVYSALNADKPEIALKLIRDQATAMRNTGDERGAGAAEAMAKAFEMDPGLAKVTMGKMLHAMAGPEKFASSFAAMAAEERAQDLHGPTLSEAESKAMTAGVGAHITQATAGAKIEQEKQAVLTAEHKRRIDDLNVQIAQADSETKRGQLVIERDKLVASQALLATEKGDTAQAQIDSAQHALNTVASLRADPLMKDTAGNWSAGMGTVLGKMLGAVPGTENKDFRGQLESLKAQVFLPAVQQVKGMGALSNAEGEKLTAAVAALDADMSPPAFRNALGVVERYMTKGLQKGLAAKAVPVQGGGLVINHPKFGPVREGDVNRLMKSYPGSTRDQIIKYLESTGGK